MMETGIDLWSFCVDVDKMLVKEHRKMGRLSKNHQNVTGICLFIRCLLSMKQSEKQTCIDMILSPQKMGYSFYLWDCFLRMYPNDWSRNLPFILLNENIEQMKEQEEVFVALSACKSLCYLESCAVNLNMRVLTQLILLARLVIELETFLEVKPIQDLFPMDLKLLNWNNWQRIVMKSPQSNTIRMLFDQVYNNAQRNVSIFPNFMFALRVARGKAISVESDIAADPNVSDNVVPRDVNPVENSLALMNIHSDVNSHLPMVTNACTRESSRARSSNNAITVTKDESIMFIMTSVQNLAKLQTNDNASLLQFKSGYEFDGFVAWKFNASDNDCEIRDLVSYFTSLDQYSRIHWKLHRIVHL
jgi:hypothetical protein